MKSCSVFLQRCQELQAELRALGVAGDAVQGMDCLLEPGYGACKTAQDSDAEPQDNAVGEANDFGDALDQEAPLQPLAARHHKLEGATTASEDVDTSASDVASQEEAHSDNLEASFCQQGSGADVDGCREEDDNLDVSFCRQRSSGSGVDIDGCRDEEDEEEVRPMEHVLPEEEDIASPCRQGRRAGADDCMEEEESLEAPEGGAATETRADEEAAPWSGLDPRAHAEAAAEHIEEASRRAEEALVGECGAAEDALVEEVPNEQWWQDLQKRCMGHLRLAHAAEQPRQRRARSWARTLAYAKAELGANGVPVRRGTAEQPCIVWVLGATDTVEAWLAEHRFFDCSNWVDNAPTVVILLGDGLRHVDVPAAPVGGHTAAAVRTSGYDAMDGLPSPDYVALLMPRSEASSPIPQHALELVKDVPAVVSTRFQLLAHDRSRLSKWMLFPQVRCPFSACPGSSALPHDDNGWVFGIWGEDLHSACNLSLRALPPPPSKPYAKKDRKSICFWGILDAKFDTSLPVLDRVRVLEAGDGRFSQFSGDGKEIRERFEAMYKLEEQSAWTVQELISSEKKFMHDKVEEVGYSHLLPQQACFARDYKPWLAMRIMEELGISERDHVVLKLCNKTRAAGVVVVSAAELDETLQQLLVVPQGPEMDAWLSSKTEPLVLRSSTGLQPGQFEENKRHWWSNECPMFLAERRCGSLPTFKGGQRYDATMRLGFALWRRADGQPLDVEWLGAYWKLPKGPSTARSSSSRLQDTVISAARSAGTAPVEPAHLSEVFAALGDLAPRLFDLPEPEVADLEVGYKMQPALAAYFMARMASAKQLRLDCLKVYLSHADRMLPRLEDGPAKRAVSSYIHRWRSILVTRESRVKDIPRKSEEVPHLQISLELWPANANTYYVQGVKLEQFNKLDEAVKCFHKCVALDPDFKAPYVYLGACHLRMGDWDKAIDISQTGSARHPGPQFHYHIGVALANLFARKAGPDLARLRESCQEFCLDREAGDAARTSLLDAEASSEEHLTRALEHLRKARSSSEAQVRWRKKKESCKSPWLVYDDELVSWLEERLEMSREGEWKCERLRPLPNFGSEGVGWLAFTCRV